jgi:predicted PurR-regulated permease PerM
MQQKQSIEISLKTIWHTVFILAGAWFLFAIKDILLLLFLAIIISSSIQPIVDKLEQKKIPRTISAVIIYVLFLALLLWGVKIVFPILGTELKDLGIVLGQYLGNFGDIFKNYANILSTWNFQEQLDSIKNTTSDGVTQLGVNIFSNTVGVFTGLFKTMIVMSLSFYMIVKKDGAWGFVKNVVPKKYERYTIGLIQRIQHQVGRWMIGQFILIGIIFILEYAVLSILHVPLALTLALLGGLLEIVPYIGPTLSIIPAVLIGLTISPWVAVLILIAYILIQQIENHIIIPLLMKKAVGLNPVVIILVLLVGGKLAGIAGLILAVPLAAAISVVWDDVANRETKIVESHPTSPSHFAKATRDKRLRGIRKSKV